MLQKQAHPHPQRNHHFPLHPLSRTFILMWVRAPCLTTVVVDLSSPLECMERIGQGEYSWNINQIPPSLEPLLTTDQKKMVLRETKNNKRLGGGDRKEKNRSKGIKSSPFDCQSLEGDVHFFPGDIFHARTAPVSLCGQCMSMYVLCIRNVKRVNG